MKNILNRILKIISSAIFIILAILIMLILAYIIRVKYLATQGRLGEVKLNFYTILTQSMVPSIYAGDVVVTYKNPNDQYKTGDILTFTSDINGGINITHRIKETYAVNGKYSYKTKGDNNSTADNEIVKGERVLGKVVLKIPKIGFLQQFLTTNHRWIIVIVVPALGVIIYDVLKVVKGFRKEEEYNIPEITNNKEEIGFGGFDMPPVNPDFNNQSIEKQPIIDETIEKEEIVLNNQQPSALEQEEKVLDDKEKDPVLITPVEIPKVLKPEELEELETEEKIETLFEEDTKENNLSPNKERQEQSKEDEEDIELL